MGPKPKMATSIPESILTPDSVETRLGTLRFFDGFPDEETVQKVYDNLDFQRGVEAFLTGLAPANSCAIREGYRSFGPDNQTLLMTESLMDARTIYLVANTETVYNMTWLDTKDGPLVVEMPPDVLGFMSDFWSRYVTDVGRVGPDRGAGGKYLLLPPGYDGEVPDGYFVLRSRTYGNAFIFRGFMKDGDLRPAIEATKQHYRVYPLDRAAAAPPMEFVDVSGKYMNTIAPADASLFDLVATVVHEEPPDAPAKDFWSVLVYDPQTRSMLQTDQRFPSVSSQKEDLVVNGDGSVDVYFGPEAPAGHESNWIQTIAGKGWFVFLRLYGPLEPWFDKTWRPGEIELID